MLQIGYFVPMDGKLGRQYGRLSGKTVALN